MMKLSISNIAWDAENDKKIYEIMKKYGYSGLEIAPTRIFQIDPYKHLNEAEKWAISLKDEYNFVISSMQSIWFGRQEKIFLNQKERNELIEYTKKAIDFAKKIGSKNLVFGCPKNRNIPEKFDSNISINFFREIGEYASANNTVIGMEANPVIYNTNYINDTVSALDLVKKVNSDGFKLNLDIGTMVYNNENVNELIGNIKYINHVHISEPGLKLIENRKLHIDLYEVLKRENYDKFISIEMANCKEIDKIEEVIKYINNIFN